MGGHCSREQQDPHNYQEIKRSQERDGVKAPTRRLEKKKKY